LGKSKTDWRFWKSFHISIFFTKLYCMKKRLLLIALASLCISVFARPKIALVLGGGGARGLAEIPFLEAIDEEGIPIDLVVGTSFGSILGAMYSSGFSPAEAREIMTNMDYLGLLNMLAVEDKHLLPDAFNSGADNYLSLEFSKNGIGSTPAFLGDNRINLVFCDYFSRIQTIDNFDELPIPFRAVATNALNGETLVIGSGSVNTAIRASMSIPVAWQPYPVGDTFTFDGGMRNNVPVSIAKELGADIVIAVDVSNGINLKPEDMSDLVGASMQSLMLMVANKMTEQHKLADIVFLPELTSVTAMDFIHVDEIVAAGEKCLAENRDKLHEFALSLQEMGVELEPKDPKRKGSINSRPDLEIESFVIRDISLIEPSYKINEKVFDSFIGKKLDSETKEQLAEKIEKLRERYHLTSMVYVPRKGSSPDKCIVEIQTNNFYHKLDKVFAGGDNSASVGKSSIDNFTRLRVVPDLNLGVYIEEPFEGLAKFHFGNLNSMELSVFPKLFETENEYKVSLKTGLRVEYGSLSPETNLQNKQRIIAEDNGFALNVGIRGSYLDMIKVEGGLEYESAFLCSDRKLFWPFQIYYETVYDSLGNPYTGLQGVKMQQKYDVGYNLPDLFIGKFGSFFFAGKFDISNRWVIVPERLSAGFDATAALNRNISRFTSGYYEYGGLYGLCGSPNGNLKRDFVLAGGTVQFQAGKFAGLPLLLIGKLNAGISDSYNPFAENPASSEIPNRILAGCEKVDFGAGLYAGVKTLFGSVIFGAGGNTTGQWSITAAFN